MNFEVLGNSDAGMGEFVKAFIQSEVGNGGTFDDPHRALHFLGSKTKNLLELLTLHTNMVDLMLETTPEKSNNRVDMETMCNGNELDVSLSADNSTKRLVVTFEIVDDAEIMAELREAEAAMNAADNPTPHLATNNGEATSESVSVDAVRDLPLKEVFAV